MKSKPRNALKLLTLVLPLAGSLVSAQAFAASEFLMPGIAGFRAAAPKVPPAYELVVAAPITPKLLPVFRLSVPRVDEQLVAGIAERFGLNAPPVADHDGSWIVESEAFPGSLTLFGESGGFNYMRKDKLYITPKQAPKLPSRREAHALALRLLNDADLLPADAQTSLDRARFQRGTLTRIDVKSGQAVTTMYTDLDVRFDQVWEGFRVSGPGSKLYVTFGDGAEVLGVTRMWREPAGVEAELQSVDAHEALSALAKGEGSAAIPEGCSTARVTHMEVVYWSRSPKQSQTHAFPAYEVLGDCLSARGQSLGAFAAYAPAAYDGAIGIEIPPAVPPGEGPPWPEGKR